MSNKFFTTMCFFAVSMAAHATNVFFNFYVDDFATVSIDGIQVGSYNNPAAAGNILFSDDLTPGLHTFSLDYKNQAGTNFLALQQQYPGDPGPSVIPLADFQSLDATSQVISGLRADYYSLAGVFQFTIYGEGPIDNGALSFSDEIYEGQPGLWAGVYGPSALFEERLSGDILITSTPEPGAMILGGVGLIAFGLKRFSRSSQRFRVARRLN
jgi:hypothetical protein